MTNSKNHVINEIREDSELEAESFQLYTKILFRTNYNSKFFPKQYERTEGPSMTVPGQSYTIREILERFTNGQTLNIEKQGTYTENPDFDDINFNPSTVQDLTDYDEVKTLNQTKIKLLSAELDEKKAKAKEKRSNDSEDDEGGRKIESKRNEGFASSPSNSEQLQNTSSLNSSSSSSSTTK